MKTARIDAMLQDEPEVISQAVTRPDEAPDGAGAVARKALLLLCGLGLVALVVGSLFGNRGMLQLLEQQERARRLESEIDSLRGENARLAGEINALRTEPRAIERLAREQLGLARPGETVFLIPEEPARR